MTTRNTSGFTLLEIMVSLAILGVGLVACMQIFGGSLRLQDRALRETRAVIFARGLMDAKLASLTLRSSTEEQPPNADGFKATTRVRRAEPEDGVNPELLEDNEDLDWTLWFVEVDVSWQDGGGFKTYSLHSMQAKPNDDD